MVTYMMVNGYKVWKMEEEFTWMLLLESFIVDSGKKAKKMDKGTWNYLTKNITMVPSIKVLKKGLEVRSLWTEISTKESTKMVNSMVKANILGQTDHAMKDSLLMESGKVRVAGSHVKIMEISILALMKVTRRTGMVGMYGPTGVSIKEDSLMTLSMFCLI